MATVRKRYRDKEKTKFMGFQADYIDQNGKRHAKLFKFEREAKAWLASVVIQVKEGKHTPERASITVKRAAELWLEHREQVAKLETATIRQYENHVESHIAKLPIAAVTLARLARPMVVGFRDEMLRTRTRVMTGKVLTSLKSILAHAMDNGHVAQNVAADVRLPKATASERRPKPKIGENIPTKAEIQKILDKTAGTPWHAIIATAALSGLRSSELRALRWVNVDIDDVDNASIHVIERANEKNVFGAPKSDAGEREVPISSYLARILQRWRDDCPKRGDLGLVFPTEIGTVQSHANIANRGWYAAQIEAGITNDRGKARYGLHAARHFFASIMIEQNHQPKRLQEMLGHASLQMTFDTYGALFKAGDAERQKINEATSFLTPVRVA